MMKVTSSRWIENTMSHDYLTGGEFMESKILKYNRKEAFYAIYRTGPFRRIALMFSAILILSIMFGCATGQSVRLPSVTSSPDGKVYAGKFVWIDLLTEDVSKAAGFYEGLFSWRAETSKEDKSYYVFSKNGKLIGGMTAVKNKDSKALESMWLLSLSVNDVDRSVAMVKERGGKLLEGPVDAAGRGRMALVSDPAGAPFILLRATGGDPVDKKAGMGEWLWTDLFTQNAKSAGVFYSALAGYRAERVKVKKDHQYDVLKRNGRVRAGIVELQWNGLEDNWLPYFKVADIEPAIQKARQLGGKLILKTDDVAILTDPTGAAFGIQMVR